VFDEKDLSGQTIKYHGKDSTKYQSKRKGPADREQKRVEASAQNQNEDGVSQSANYALMIFDKKKNAFRLVPI
jgi:hypothetical protein